MFALAGWWWWPLPVLLAPLYFYLVFFKIFIPEANWGRLEELKSGSAKWTPRGKDAQWLDGDWQVRAGLAGGWRTIKIPSDVATLSGFSRLPRLEFRKTFTLEGAAEGDRIFLGLLGAGGRVTVKVDGRVAARNLYGYIPTEFEISDLLSGGRDAEHEVLIRINRSSASVRAVSEMCFGPPFAEGLFRDVYVQARGSVFIEDAWLEAGKPGERAEVKVLLNGGIEHPIAVSGAIEDESGAPVFTFEDIVPGIEGKSTVSFTVPEGKLKPWSRFKPYLYTLKIRILTGDVTDRFERAAGFKRLTMMPEGYAVNGKAERLYGVKRTEHFPPYGGAFPDWSMKRDATLAKESMLNLLWSAHYPMHPVFLDVCDREGIYVIQELPVADVLAGSDGTEHALARLDELMRRASAHPSFLFWYLDHIGLRVTFEAKGRVLEFLNRAVAEGRLVLSASAARRMGVSQPGPEIVETALDMYGRWDWDSMFKPAREGETNLCVLDVIDGRGGSDGRHAREMRKADADQKALQAAERAGAAGIVLGHMFGWGLRMGIMSVTRKKKVSMDVVRDYIKNRTTGGINVPKRASEWPARLPAVAMLMLIAFVMLQQQGSRFILSYPLLATAFIPLTFQIVLKECTFLTAVVSLGNYLDRNPGYIYALAPRLRFPVFLRLASSWPLKAILAGGFYAWLQGVGLIALMRAGAGSPQSLAGPLAIASIADILFAALIIPEIEAAPLVAGVALIHGIMLAEFLPPGAAALFTAVVYAPLLAAALLLRKKSAIY